MLNKILHFSLNNRIVVLALSVALLISGCFALVNTEIDIFPDLNAPTVTIMTEAPGFAPEEVEKMVTYPIESSMNGAAGVRRVRSSSSTGFSVVWVEFDWGTDIYHARQTVSEKLSVIGEELPEGIGSPTLGPQSSILGEVMIVGLTSDTVPLPELRMVAERIIKPRLLSLGGVSQVSVIGGDEIEYQILASPDKLKFYDVSLDELTQAVENLNSNASGGIMYDYGNEYIIKGDIATTSIDELSATVVKTTGNGNVVTLADIADVTKGPKTPRLGAASEKARGAVLVTITKQPGVATIELTENVEMCLENMKSNLPANVNVSTDIFRQSRFIEASIGNLQTSLFEGAIFVIIVLFIFLMNVRTTIISVVALPLSIIITVLILHLMGQTINTMSLGGIAIAIGSLVDDAIVDVENVYKRLRENRLLPQNERQAPLRVIYEASKEVRLPIFNSSLIIIASFMPLFFLSGIEGRMMIPLGISFIVALIASTLTALTVTPVLCSYLLSSPKQDSITNKEPVLSAKLKQIYHRTLKKCLQNPKPIIWATGGLLVTAVVVLFMLGRSFLPPFNEGSFTINISTLPGISLEESDRLGRMAEEMILEEPEVVTVARKTGRAELDEHSFGANVSELEVPYILKERSRSELASVIRRKLNSLPGVNVEIGQPISHRIDAMLSGAQAQIAIKIFGDDLTTLFRTGNKIKSIITGIDGVVDANVEQQVERPQIDIRPRRVMLARYGVSPGQFAEFVSTGLGGKVVSRVYEQGLPYDVTLKFDDSSRSTIEDLSNLTIDTNKGKVPLSQLADIISSTGPNTINRENVSRRIIVSANVENRDLRTTVDEIRDAIASEIKLPDNYYIEYGGQFESEESASRTLAMTSLGALAIIFMLLFYEYRDVRQSLLALINMPLAMIGGVFLLAVTSGELNIPAIIGFISLLGISTRNGMLLMSRYNALRDGGLSKAERVIKGSVDRLLPIIMTALTSALALIPLALRGDEPGNEIQSPLAIVILGGLLSSTILNIFVVPILYDRWIKS